MVARALTRSVLALVAAFSLTAFVAAQTPAQKAGDVYLAFLADLAKAKKVDEVTKYMTAKSLADLKKTPPAQVPEMFGMLKEITGMHTAVKVTKETPTATGATLEVSGLGPDKKPTTGTVEMIKEGGAWKVGPENWK